MSSECEIESKCVPAQVCPNCREAYIDEKVAARLFERCRGDGQNKLRLRFDNMQPPSPQTCASFTYACPRARSLQREPDERPTCTASSGGHMPEYDEQLRQDVQLAFAASMIEGFRVGLIGCWQSRGLF